MRAIFLVASIGMLGCSASRTLDPTPDPPGTIDVIGTWHTCASIVTFEEGGAAAYTDLRAGCTTTGTFDLDANVLEVTWADSECVRDGNWMRELVAPDGGLVMVDPITAATSRYAEDSAPRSRWLLTSAETGQSTTVRVVGTPGEGVGSGCYWSTDHGCGGLFSCSGTVHSWEHDGTSIHGATGCTGECPCGAVVDATADSDGSFSATYHGASCEMVLDGAFTIMQIDD